MGEDRLILPFYGGLGFFRPVSSSHVVVGQSATWIGVSPSKLNRNQSSGTYAMDIPSEVHYNWALPSDGVRAAHFDECHGGPQTLAIAYRAAIIAKRPMALQCERHPARACATFLDIVRSVVCIPTFIKPPPFPLSPSSQYCNSPWVSSLVASQVASREWFCSGISFGGPDDKLVRAGTYDARDQDEI